MLGVGGDATVVAPGRAALKSGHLKLIKTLPVKPSMAAFENL